MWAPFLNNICVTLEENVQEIMDIDSNNHSDIHLEEGILVPRALREAESFVQLGTKLDQDTKKQLSPG